MSEDWKSFGEMLSTKSTDRCVVRRFIDDLPDEGMVAVEAALDRGDSIPAIRDALRKIRPGHGRPGEQSWYRHRQRGCVCYRGDA